MLSDRALDEIALARGIKVTREELEEEVYQLNIEAAHQRQYAAMMHGADSVPAADEAARNALTEQAMQNIRIRRLIEETIREQAFEVTPEELEEEARAVAERQKVSLDMVRGFFGDDFGLLRRDVLEKKALAYLEETA